MGSSRSGLIVAVEAIEAFKPYPLAESRVFSILPTPPGSPVTHPHTTLGTT